MFFGLRCYWYLSVSVNRLISMGTQQTLFADKKKKNSCQVELMFHGLRYQEVKVIYWDKLH